MNKPTLLAPAGDFKCLSAAVEAGADAVYFGIGAFNMRAKATNFTLDDLPRVVAYCREHNVATHVTVNTIVYEHELPALRTLLEELKAAGVDLVICWDMAVIEVCRDLEMPFCVSTQASVSNAAAARFYESLGAKRIVPARECSLENLRSIIENSNVEIEVFAHGAMCVAISGRCLMSQYLCNESGNRGECKQPCRWEYEIHDPVDGHSLMVGRDYVLSPKDVCTIEILDQLIDAGIHSFKIEGRMRSPEYVAKVVSTYRRAIDLHAEGKLTPEITAQMKEELATVFNRGFSTGFYLGTPGFGEKANTAGSKATTKKSHLGSVVEYYKREAAALLQLEAGDLNLGDTICIIGDTSGVTEITVDTLRDGFILRDTAAKGCAIIVNCPKRVQPGDQAYRMTRVE